MKRRAPELEPELESLLRFRTVARQLPDDVRARVLARGRTFVSGRRAMSRASPSDPKPSATSISQGGRLRRLAIAAAIAILAGAAGAVAALRSRALTLRRRPFRRAPSRSPVRVREETGLDPSSLTVTAAPAAATHHAVTSKPHPVTKGARCKPAGRGRAAAARPPCVCAPRLSGCAGAGRRTRAPLPRWSPGRRVRGVAGRVAPGRRARGRSQTRRCCVCKAVPAQRSPARYRRDVTRRVSSLGLRPLITGRACPLVCACAVYVATLALWAGRAQAALFTVSSRLRRRARLSRRAGLRGRRQGAAGLRPLRASRA